MFVAMMHIRCMRMGVLERLMLVRVAVRLRSFVAAMGMLVVLVVGVQVLVRQEIVGVLVRVALGE